MNAEEILRTQKYITNVQTFLCHCEKEFDSDRVPAKSHIDYSSLLSISLP